MTCPHDNIIYCPLYVAAHDAGLYGFSCARGEWGPEGGPICNDPETHAAELQRLRARDPRLVAECEWKEQAQHVRQQRQRNMRAAGVQ